MLVDMDVATSINLEAVVVMGGSGGRHYGGSFSPYGAREFHFWDQSFMGWCSSTTILTPMRILRRRV